MQFMLNLHLKCASIALVLAAAVTARPSDGAAQSASADPLVAAMARAGVAKIAIASLPPYAYRLPSGEAQGYMIDIVGNAMKALGVPKIEAITTTFDAMVPGLQAKQFDFVPAGLNITSARCNVVVFSAPVTVQNDALYVLPSNPKKLTGYNSVARAPDVQLAVLTGSTQEAFALKQGAAPTQLVKVPDVQAGIAAVTGGRADAFVVGQFSVPNFTQRGVAAVVDRESPLSGVGIAFRTENTATRDAINAKIAEMRTDGRLKHLYEQYGFTNWDVLSKLTKPSDIAPGCT